MCGISPKLVGDGRQVDATLSSFMWSELALRGRNGSRNVRRGCDCTEPAVELVVDFNVLGRGAVVV